MPPRTKGEIRRSQIITTYGIGSIVPVEDESFMVAGIDRWAQEPLNLHEPRLERRLRVNGFRLPPASENGADVPVVRFPTWSHCPSCRRLDSHSRLSSLFRNECNACRVNLIPSRFVICCVNGHIDDFPYFRWVHVGSERTDGEQHRMTMESTGDTASLADIVITCTCKKRATMEGAFAKTAMRDVTRCAGRRPWLSANDETCDETPRALQRGASNVWFSLTHSAISIPPWSEGAFLVLNKHWEMLRHLTDDASLRGVLDRMGLAAGTDYTTDDLVDAVNRRRANETADDEELADALKRDEYLALLNGSAERSRSQQFVCIPAEEVPDALSGIVDRVMLVKKLREVRALESFSRIVPPESGPAAPRPPLFDENPGWLPAVEVNGEGVFMTLSNDTLTEWEADPRVNSRVAQIDKNYRARFAARGLLPDRCITPRFVLIHTLAHAVIDQWALDSGYPASALRERIYANDSMAGFLIYTATSDSAGSLGGVIAEAEPARLSASIRELHARTSWCSADPLCIESSPNGVDGLNLAACHSCMLLPEVSCEEMNTLLDRALLVGVPDAPEVGFLQRYYAPHYAP
jgi:hypothetical protein